MKVLLTSTGLETKEIREVFEKMVDKEMNLVKALFIPVAAINAGAIAVLPKCMNDLLNCNIQEQNITVWDMHESMTQEELNQYDIVYLCGGVTAYLLERVNDTGFDKVLMNFINENRVVVGVSAGSIIFANNLQGNLGLVDTKLDVHCQEGDGVGAITIPIKDNIKLTDTRAIAVHDSLTMEIVGECIKTY